MLQKAWRREGARRLRHQRVGVVARSRARRSARLQAGRPFGAEHAQQHGRHLSLLQGLGLHLADVAALAQQLHADLHFARAHRSDETGLQAAQAGVGRPRAAGQVAHGLHGQGGNQAAVAGAALLPVFGDREGHEVAPHAAACDEFGQGVQVGHAKALCGDSDDYSSAAAVA